MSKMWSVLVKVCSGSGFIRLLEIEGFPTKELAEAAAVEIRTFDGDIEAIIFRKKAWP